MACESMSSPAGLTRASSSHEASLRRVSQPKLIIICLEGTKAGSIYSSRVTSISCLSGLFSEEENTVVLNMEGVGSMNRCIKGAWQAITGSGAKKIVFQALRYLAKNYRKGDSIIFLGFSRGAWQACYLAHLVDRLGGLPIDGDERFYYQLYKKSSKLRLVSSNDVRELLRSRNYRLRTGIKIKALCLFDMVSSMGLPTTGIASPLVVFKRSLAKDGIVANIPKNVHHVFHAVALHEDRPPYMSTLLKQDERLRQVAFPGSHSNLGWMERESSNPLILGPLAWMIQQLAFIGIQFDDLKLGQIFSAPRHGVPIRPWYEGRIFSSRLQRYILGDTIRKPWMAVNPDDGSPAVQVHRGARLRAFGLKTPDATIPGYRLSAEESGECSWTLNPVEQTRRISKDDMFSMEKLDCPFSSSISTAEILYEAPFGSLEHRLLKSAA